MVLADGRPRELLRSKRTSLYIPARRHPDSGEWSPDVSRIRPYAISVGLLLPIPRRVIVASCNSTYLSLPVDQFLDFSFVESCFSEIHKSSSSPRFMPAAAANGVRY